MKKFFISSVTLDRSATSDCVEREFESYKDCLVYMLEAFGGVECESENVDDLEEHLRQVESENCGEWSIVSVIEEGRGIVYVGH